MNEESLSTYILHFAATRYISHEIFIIPINMKESKYVSIQLLPAVFISDKLSKLINVEVKNRN